MRTFLRVPAVAASTGRSPSRVYADVKAGVLTSPIKLGVRASGWPSDEVEAIVRARIAGSTPEEIRSLVLKLEAARKQLRNDGDERTHQVHLSKRRVPA